MNKKGQALVEFIIILPIIIFVILGLFDYANITKTRMELESIIEDVIIDDTLTLDNTNISKDVKDGKITYTLTKKVSISCPILSKVLPKPYQVEVKRVVNE